MGFSWVFDIGRIYCCFYLHGTFTTGIYALGYQNFQLGVQRQQVQKENSTQFETMFRNTSSVHYLEHEIFIIFGDRLRSSPFRHVRQEVFREGFLQIKTLSM
jgi:hypothetical protein